MRDHDLQLSTTVALAELKLGINEAPRERNSADNRIQQKSCSNRDERYDHSSDGETESASRRHRNCHKQYDSDRRYAMIPGEMIINPMTEEDTGETDVSIDVVLSRPMNGGAIATGATNLQVV